MRNRLIASIITAATLALGVSGVADAASSTHAPYAGVAKDGPTVKPYGIQGRQEYWHLTPQEWRYAADIIREADALHMPPYAGVIAVATAMQESHLYNYTYAADHDSLGLFQQRPSCGWGTAAQIEDPTYAAGAFLRALDKIDYRHMTLTDAAQTVQGSAFPGAYAKWQNEASTIVVHISRGTH